MLTPDELIDVLRRTCDEAWLSGLLADPSSRAVLYTLANQWSLVSDSGDSVAASGSISDSPGGAPGVAVVTMERAAAGIGGTIPKGYAWRDTRSIVAVLQQDFPVPPAALSIDIPIQTLRLSDLVNTIDDDDYQVSIQSPVVLDTGGINPLIAPLGTPGTIATTFILVTSSTPTTFGATDFLSVNGTERSQFRATGEDTAAYRARVRNIPDAVSPVAIVDALNGVANQNGLPEVTVLEPFPWSDLLTITAASFATPIVITTSIPHGLTTGELVRVTGVNGNTGANGDWYATVLTPTTFALDDSIGSGAYTSGGIETQAYPNLDHFDGLFCDQGDFCDDLLHEMRDLRTSRAYFEVLLDAVPEDPDGLVFFADASFVDDPVWGYLDVGVHPQVLAGLLAVANEANAKRAGGVQFDVIVPIGTDYTAVGTSAAGAYTLVWTLAPPTGFVWLLVIGIFSHSSPVLVPSASQRIKITYEDLSSVTIQWDHTDSQVLRPDELGALGGDPQKRIISIEGRVLSDGVVTETLVGQLEAILVAA